MHEPPPSNAPERERPDQMLSAETLSQVRDAVRRALSDTSSDKALSEALHRLADEARARGMRAEHVIILLKGMLGEMDGDWRGGGDRHAATAARVVTRAIEAYYRTDV
jgi:hypothetical protein